MNILVVEDDTEIAAFVSRGLRRAGYLVDGALDGLSGEKMARNAIYDAAIVDFRCAGASHVVGHRGPQVAQRVRQGAARETAGDIHHRPRRNYGRIGRRRGAARIDGGRVFAEIVYLL